MSYSLRIILIIFYSLLSLAIYPVNSDFTRVSQRLTFTPGNTTQCVRFEIHGTDMQCEIEESFLVHIDIITGQSHAGLFRQNATVVITDAGPRKTFILL